MLAISYNGEVAVPSFLHSGFDNAYIGQMLVP